MKGASRWVLPQVERVVSAVRGAGVYQVPANPLLPTRYPFVIPKSSEKVSLVLSCVKQNREDGAKPPTFKLDSWEEFGERPLQNTARRTPFCGTH